MATRQRQSFWMRIQKGSGALTLRRLTPPAGKQLRGQKATTNRPDNDFYMEHGYVPDQVILDPGQRIF